MYRVTRASYKEKMLEHFNESMDYIELLDWVDSKLEFVPIGETFPRHRDPLNILEYGRGRCGEHARLYVAACVAHGYNARLVFSLDPDDHVWAEVMVNGSWIHVDPSDKYWDDPLRRYYRGKNITRVIAFELFRWMDVTKKYRR